MIDLDGLSHEELIALRERIHQKINDREFIRRAEAEANSISQRWHQAQTRNLEEGEVLDWVQPVGAHDSYPINWRVRHNGEVWYSAMAGNVWEPGVSGWRILAPEGEHDPWTRPTGAHDAYNKGDVTTHIDKVWISRVNGNVWEPPEQWDEVIDEPEEPIEEPVDPEDPPVDPEEPGEEPEPPTDPEEPPVEEPEYPAWVPWDNIRPLYQIGDRVTHKGDAWESTVGNNHWEPGVYGWKEISAE